GAVGEVVSPRPGASGFVANLDACRRRTKHGTKLMEPATTSEILPPPLQLLIIAMHHVPRRPAAVEVSGIADKLGGHVQLLQRRIHLLGFLDRDAAIRFSMH